MNIIAKRSAFTMMEMIFVIVILGILAAVALPKLSATRDDAKSSRAAMDLATAVQDIGSHYTSTGDLDLGYTNAVVTGNCFTMVMSDSNGDGENDAITVATSMGDGNYCPLAIAIATKNKLIGTHVFKGTKVSF